MKSTAAADERRPSGQPPHSLRATVAWTLVGIVSYAGCQWLTLMTLTKLGTREMVGEYSYALALTAPVTVLTSLYLRGVQATDAKGQYPFRTYFTLRLMGVAVSFLVVGVMAVAIDGKGFAAVLLLFGLARGAEAIADVCFGLFQRHERMDLIAVSMISKGLASVLAFTVLVWRFQSVAAGTVGILLAWGSVLVLYDLPHVRRMLSDRGDRSGLRPRWEPASLWKLTLTALPMGVVLFLVSLNGNIPRYFVERAVGLADLGLFSALTYVVVAAGMIQSALGQAASPRLAVRYAEGNLTGFVRLTWQLTGLSVALGIGTTVVAAVAGRSILTLLYRPEYAAAQPIFFWIAMASTLGFVGSALGYCLTATRSFRPQAPLSILVTIVTIGASWALIPRFHLHGAIGAMALSNGAQAFGYLWLIRSELRRNRATARVAGSCP